MDWENWATHILLFLGLLVIVEIKTKLVAFLNEFLSLGARACKYCLTSRKDPVYDEDVIRDLERKR